VDRRRSFPTVSISGGQPVHEHRQQSRSVAGRIVKTVAVGETPLALAFDGAKIWVANLRSNAVTAIRASDGAVVGNYPAGEGPGGLAFDGEHIWVADREGGTVTKLLARDGHTLGTFRGRQPAARPGRRWRESLGGQQPQ
jgi:DNA-binding beta-propeller fold protein YncE